MLLEEAWPVCPEDADAHPPQPSTLPTPSRREVKQGQQSVRGARCRDPSSSPHSHGSTSYTPANPGVSVPRQRPEAGPGGCRPLCPLSSSGQTGKGRQGAECIRRQARGPELPPKRRRPGTQGHPTIARRTACSSAGTWAPLPTTPAGGLEAPGQPCEGTLTF